LARALLGLKDLQVHYVLPFHKEDRWAFGDEAPGSSGPCPLDLSAKFLLDIYTKFPLENWDQVDSVPYLVDKQTCKGVSNGSADIVSFLRNKLALPASAFKFPDEEKLDFWEFASFIGASFELAEASTQEQWDNSARELYAALKKCDDHLKVNKFCQGDVFSKDDVLFWPFLMSWETSHRFTCKLNVSLGTHFPNCFAYLKRVAEVLPDKTMIGSVYNQANVDFGRCYGEKIISKIPDVPLF
jgi:putative glutathione S-transferase